MSLLFALMLNLVHADDICGKYMPCGAWEGAVYNIEEGQQSESWIERMEIKAIDDHSYGLMETMWETAEKKEPMYVLNLVAVFGDDGRYTVANKNGSLFASGVCANKVCTFDFTPWAWTTEDGKTSGVTGNVNVLRFLEDKIERTMLATSVAGKHMVQKSSMLKQ